MANASKKHLGPSSSGKGSGAGAGSDLDPEAIVEHQVLSNRDKAFHNRGRGLDSKGMKTDQLRDHAANRTPREEEEG